MRLLWNFGVIWALWNLSLFDLIEDIFGMMEKLLPKFVPVFGRSKVLLFSFD